MTDRSLPRSIDSYLKQLRRALADADKALIQDALYDAEEYLRNELRDNPGKTEADVLAGVAGSYGAPEEVADAYRQTEATVQAALRTPRRLPSKPSSLARFFGVMADPRAYTATLFLLLGLPVGIFLSGWVVAGLSISVGFSVMIFGLPLFLLFLASVRLFSLVEGRMIEGLLGVRMPRRPLHPGERRVWWRKIIGMVTDGRTWSAILYMLLKLPLGIVSFGLVVGGLQAAFSLILFPIANAFPSHIHIWFGTPGMPPPWEQMLLVLGGILMLPALMRLFRGLALLQAHIAHALLVKLRDGATNGDN